MLTTEWDAYFMDLAIAVSAKSKDASIKHGAIIVRPDKSIASTGFNGFSPRIPDVKAYLTGAMYRQQKLDRVIHSEVNAIRYCRDHDTTDYLMYVTGPPCKECAKLITTTGINKLAYLVLPEFEARWKESIDVARELFNEAGVELFAMEVASGA